MIPLANNLSAHLSANGTTAVKTGPGVLHTVTINTKGATANTLTLSDGSTTLAVIDTTAGVGTLTYDIQFQVGLTAALASGTAADVTISFT